MAKASADQAAVEYKAAAGQNKRRKLHYSGKIVYTTSGAVDTTNSEVPTNVAYEKPTGTGLYRITVPTGKTISVQLTHMDASGGAHYVTGKSATASTGVVDYTVTGAGGSAADATSGDSTHFSIDVEC